MKNELIKSEISSCYTKIFNLLVVEDDPSFRSFLESFFRSKGFRVFPTESPEKALGLLQYLPHIDIAYLDINYSYTRMNGFSLAQKLNGLTEYCFPFVIMSMDDSVDNHRASEEVGALAFVQKDYRSFDESVKFIRDVLMTGVATHTSYRIFNRETLKIKLPVFR